MAEEPLNIRQEVDERGYESNRDHIFDELQRLDLLIYSRVNERRNCQAPDPLDQFRGLVLSEKEIDCLLSDITGASSNQYSDNDCRALLDALSECESRIEQRRTASLKANAYLSLNHLSLLFHLSPFEERCLMICLAVELDRKYEKLYAYLQDDVTCKKPSVDLVFSLLCKTAEERINARLAFDAQAPLLRYRLLKVLDSSPQGSTPLLARTLKLDDRITNFLLGFDRIEARAESAVQVIYPKTGLDQAPLAEHLRNQIRAFTRFFLVSSRPNQPRIVFYFHGPYGAGKRQVSEGLCHDLGLPLIVCDLKKCLYNQEPPEDIIWLSAREALLQQGALCFDNFGELLGGNENEKRYLNRLFEAIETFSDLTFLLGDRPWHPRNLVKKTVLFNELPFTVPDDLTRKNLWQTRLNDYCRQNENIDPGALASKFRFTAGQIHDALQTAQNLARWRSSGNGSVSAADLYAACRAQSNHKLGLLARKVQSNYTWNDLVLPLDQINQLKEICNQARLRHVVYGKWGFDRKLSLGKGLNVLFSGPPGTGKTMAAEVIAGDMQLDLYKIDLSQVVSKYIGETEKNLDRIFTEAQSSNAILFFDEADALFGKRSEVKDAHDRYANIEIGYLLQKMEEYDGIAMLATNVRQNMDEAFVRRIHSIVEFPFPDEKLREQIWIKIFPDDAPLSGDIDYAFLSRSFRIAGGNIKNAALTAAFYAAEETSGIVMRHLVIALKRELQKMGKLCVQADFGKYYSVIQEGAGV